MDDVLHALKKQRCRYTLESISPLGHYTYDAITSIAEVIEFEPRLTTFIDRAADPSTRIISFTVTEGGYYLHADGTLNVEATDVVRDLAFCKAQIGQQQQTQQQVALAQEHDSGFTLYGALSLMLFARMKAHAGPITLLSCDNLLSNGDTFRGGFVKFLTLLENQELLSWIIASTRCPNSMVDKITPRPSFEVQARVFKATNSVDEVPVMGESFSQWVIEDEFAAGRPRLENCGVEIVSTVVPYEEAKICLLNAPHSLIAWAGTLFNYTFIHEGARDPVVHKLAFEYATNDAIPTLTKTQGLDLAKYRDVVLERFCNAALNDTNIRVASGGFTKVPSFIRPTISKRLLQDESISSVAMLPALFLAVLQRWYEGKTSYTDEAMNEEDVRAICIAVDPVKAFVANKQLWGDLAGDARLELAMQVAFARVEELQLVHEEKKKMI